MLFFEYFTIFPSLRRAVQKQYYEMSEFVGFQTMGILVPYGITFDAVGVFGLAFHL